MTRIACMCVLGALVAGSARADSIAVSGAADGEDSAVVELSHTVDVELADRTATFRVERVLSSNAHERVKVETTIDLPTRGVVRSFRVLSGDRWIDARLLPASAAVDEFLRLTTSGEQLEHGPVMMDWADEGVARITEYPLPPGARRRLAYTIEAPVCFARGRWIADYAKGGGDLAQVVVRARGARVFTAAQLERELGESVDDACQGDVPITASDAVTYIVGDAPIAAPAAVRFARASVAGADVVRMSIDVATELAPAPRGARVVFVVDASKSVAAAGVAAQLAWVRGYLAHVPDATFEIVLYRRWPERMFGRFEPAAHATALIDAIDPSRLRPGNGSHLDRGLEVAAQLLAGGPPCQRSPGDPGCRGDQAARRVVAFTDERWRPSFSAPDAAPALAALPADAIVHLVDVSGAGDDATPPALSRDDDDPLFEVARRWGGIAARATGGVLAPHGAFADAALELVRPLRIDHAVLHRDATSGDDELGDLAGGLGLSRAWRAIDATPVSVDGMIWGRTFRERFATDPDASRRWTAELIADPVRAQLTDPEILAFATAASALSPMTSFLAVDPRYPAAAAPDWGEGDDIGSGTIGTGLIGSSSTCDIGVGHSEPTPSPDLIARLIAPRALACAVQHHQRRWDLAVGVDTTGIEIVDVEVRARILDDDALALAADPRDADAFDACVEDAAWDVDLDARFAPFTHHYEARVIGSR